MSRLIQFLLPTRFGSFDDGRRARLSELAEEEYGSREHPLVHHYVHARRYLMEAHYISVESSRPCRIFLVNDINHARYHIGRDFRAFGGAFSTFPARLRVPRSGVWNILIDLDGTRGELAYSITYMKPRDGKAGRDPRQLVHVYV